MKRLFGKKSPVASSSQPTPQLPTSHRSILSQPPTTGLQPKYSLPPIPQPHPHEHIALLATSDGLLLRPHIFHRRHRHDDDAQSVIRLLWGKTAVVNEVAPETLDSADLDWEDALIIYGLVGVLELFSGAYLLVITGKTDIGHVLEPSHAVYGIKSVAAIPLTSFEHARTALNTLASRNKQQGRPSLIPSNTIDTISSATTTTESEDTPTTTSPGRQVQFAETNDIKVMSPRVDKTFDADVDDTPSRSGASTPSSEHSVTSPNASTTNIAKTLANRLSFWNKTPSSDVKRELSAVPDATSNPDAEPEQVLDSILQRVNEKEPTSSEERNSELDEKIVRECVREFSKGEMFFAYAFDITRSLQHKYQQLGKAQKMHDLLKDLNVETSNHSLKSDNSKEKGGRKSVDKNKRWSIDHFLEKDKGKSSFDALLERQAEAPAPLEVHPLTDPSPMLPLWRRVDRQFWWNEWLSKAFIDAGLHSYVLPIMQGHIQISGFDVPTHESQPFIKLQQDAAQDSKLVAGAVTEPNKQSATMEEPTFSETVPVEYLIISRRSKDRAGLRYQRRGIDDEARVANFVETETIVRVERDGTPNVFSYVQIRGSIPLFWTQSGYGLKPAPQLSAERTPEQNLDAMRRHFTRTLAVYGPHTIVNLAEQTGKEGAVTQAYGSYVESLKSPDIRYCAYDFHTETKGMKYENISKLIEKMERTFESQGYFWVSGKTVLSEQKGVYRVNCIDCLDRTNVIQSAFARYMLNRQLSAIALLNPSLEGKSDADIVFNNLWADNGDAISRAYAGTSALKGDFTRTGKRDLAGLLNDGVNSLARMYTSTFSDWFSQAVIDFMLGSRSLSVFSEFLHKLSSSDPQDLIRLSKIRAEAIATSVSRVLSEGESLLSGWTLFAPEELNVKVGEKWEEKVLLLTVNALYIISYDYTLQKVKMYTRVPLGDIIKITKGPYILSPLEEASRNPKDNAGFIVTWRNQNQVTRVTSYSVRNSFQTPPSSPGPATTMGFPSLKTNTSPRSRISFPTRKNTLSMVLNNVSASSQGEKTFAAFKALPVDPARVRSASNSSDYMEPANELSIATNCEEAVNVIVDSIRLACQNIGNIDPDFVEDGDIVGLAEAQRMTSMYAKMEYGVKRLLWLGS